MTLDDLTRNLSDEEAAELDAFLSIISAAPRMIERAIEIAQQTGATLYPGVLVA